jgi:hypothetical protein
MGFDWSCIAVPLDAAPVRAIRADEELWDQALTKPPFGELWPGEEMPAISRELLAVVPPGTKWIYEFGDRSFDQAEYLFDPVAFRAAGDDEVTPANGIIFGAEPFAAHAKGGQGVPWRCSGGAYLKAAANTIDSLDVATVRGQFSVAEMHDLGVYQGAPRRG